MLGKGRLFLFGTIEEEKKKYRARIQCVIVVPLNQTPLRWLSPSLSLFCNFSYIFREISETGEFLFLATNKTEAAQRERREGPDRQKTLVCACAKEQINIDDERMYECVCVCASKEFLTLIGKKSHLRRMIMMHQSSTWHWYSMENDHFYDSSESAIDRRIRLMLAFRLAHATRLISLRWRQEQVNWWYEW